jgi:hypothetical protein
LSRPPPRKGVQHVEPTFDALRMRQRVHQTQRDTIKSNRGRTSTSFTLCCPLRRLVPRVLSWRRNELFTLRWTLKVLRLALHPKLERRGDDHLNTLSARHMRGEPSVCCPLCTHSPSRRRGCQLCGEGLDFSFAFSPCFLLLQRHPGGS